jgi:hypothetical protein
MLATITQGNTGLFILDVTADPPDSGGADIDAGLYYVDQDTGLVYERDAIDGDDAADGSWTAGGKLLPFVGDQAAPAAPTGLAVVATTVQNDDGTQVPGFTVSWNANTEADLIGYTLQIDETTATWANPIEVSIGLTVDILIREGIIAGTGYDFRLAARDAEGFRSSWSSTVSETALPDGTAPAVPTGINVINGYKQLGVTWDRNQEADLAFYQVRHHLTSDAETAVIIQTRSSHVVLAGLTEDVSYDVDVRAIDRSGNVATSDTDLTGLDYLENPESGWATVVAGTPTLVGSADIVAGTVVTNFLASGVISADAITSGTLDVGGTSQPGEIEVWNAQGYNIATLNDDGLLMRDPNNAARAMWLKAGSLKFTDDFDTDIATTVWTTAVTPDGINASAITFGTGGGGANSVPNAGFEMAAFAVIVTKLWTATADWATATNQVNLNTAGASLTMTSAS